MKRIVSGVASLIGFALLFSSARAAAPEFFKGNTIRLVVGNSAGGAMGDWGGVKRRWAGIRGGGPGMFCTTISGRPGICLLRCCAIKRAQSSIAPPAELPTTSLIVLPLKNSGAAARALLKRRAKPNKKTTLETTLFIRSPSLSLALCGQIQSMPAALNKFLKR